MRGATVREWLGSLGLAQYVELFAANAIDGDVLPDLTDDELKELGLPLGHRKKLLKAIVQLEAPEPVGEYAAVPRETLTGSLPAEGERRLATVLFADISGYTALCTNVDAEHVQDLLSRFFGVMDSIVESFGGYVLDHAGDAVTGVFGAPVAHGNDAERAVRASLDMHKAAGQIIDPMGHALGLHIGIASGETVAAVITTGTLRRYAVTGETVNLAARLNALAKSGETLISESLHRTLSRVVEAEPLGNVALKGFDHSVPVWRIRGLSVGASESYAFVGRHNEIRQLRATMETVLETGVGATILIRGEPGIGKSRFAREISIRASAMGYACHVGYVLDFGAGKGQDAVALILKDLLQIALTADENACESAIDRMLRDGLVRQDDRMFVSELLELPQKEQFRAVFQAMDSSERDRRTEEVFCALVKEAAAQKPRMVAVEDIHWGSPRLLRHLARLTALASHCPLLLLMTSRIDGDPLDNAWRASTQRSSLMTVDLGPLRLEEAQLMAIGLVPTSSALAVQCIERAEGNPLFLEQLLRNTLDTENAQLPDTIQSLVLARIDRLGEKDKVVLQAASVIGQRFAIEAVQFLSGEPGERCKALIASGLLRQEGGSLIFAHALIHEGVYASLLHSKRREMHRMAAEWFKEQDLTLRAEHLDRAADETAAHAYLDAAAEQSQRYRYDIALRLATRGIELAKKPSVGHALAMLRGELSVETGRSQEAIFAFQSAKDLAQDELQTCRALLGLAGCYRQTGDFAPAMEALDHAESIATRLELASESSRVCYTRGSLLFARAEVAASQQQLQRALAYATQGKDAASEAHALSTLADTYFGQGRMLASLDCCSRCCELCQREGMVRLEVLTRAVSVYSIYHSSGDLDLAETVARDSLGMARKFGLFRGEFLALQALGIVLTEKARYAEAEAALARSIAMASQAKMRRLQSLSMSWLATIQRMQGHRPDALETLRLALEQARQTGLGFHGPPILVGIALASDDPLERSDALQEGEMLLQEGCLAHCHLLFYRDAIDVALAQHNWPQALRYTEALNHFLGTEPNLWARLAVARGRCLADLGISGLSEAHVSELKTMRASAERAGFMLLVPGIDAVLDREAQHGMGEV